MAAAASDALAKLGDTVRENKTAAVCGGLAVTAAAAALLYKRAQSSEVVKQGELKPETLPAGAYDAVIVGAGPSGSTTAYYFAKGGGRVALLEKATFPRGEARRQGAVCSRVQLEVGGLVVGADQLPGAMRACQRAQLACT
jgi:heterodisulfide reductase subunit A-like polyferredoxin